MYSGPIKLPEVIQTQCNSLVNLGNVLQLYSISIFIHILDVNRRIVSDNATIMDLQEIIMLCDAITSHPSVDDNLSNDINMFKDNIKLFITTASQPVRSCGMWSNVCLDFDEDQYL